MNKVLIAVDGTKGSRKAFTTTVNFCACMNPRTISLVYVEKFEGRSLIDEMLGDAEMKTLQNVLRGTEYQAALDRKARTVLQHYKKLLQGKGLTRVRTLVKKGHPAEEILKAAKADKADLIIIGSRGRRASRLFMGSVSREVANSAEIPVLLVK